MRDWRWDEVDRILEKKGVAYAEFLSATLLLKKAMEADEMGAVTHWIERRAALIRVVEDLDRELRRCQKGGLLDPAEEIVRRAAALYPALGETLRRIFTENRECEAIAAGRLSKLGKELQTIHETGEGLHGYIRHPGPISRFLNVRM